MKALPALNRLPSDQAAIVSLTVSSLYLRHTDPQGKLGRAVGRMGTASGTGGKMGR